jgi:hypothetical protein
VGNHHLERDEIAVAQLRAARRLFIRVRRRNLSEGAPLALTSEGLKSVDHLLHRYRAAQQTAQAHAPVARRHAGPRGS